MATLIIKNIPEDIKNNFKAVCAEKGKTLKEELIRLMKEEIDKFHKKK